jgi:thiol-disulfide isomerase/thioredoxin
MILQEVEAIGEPPFDPSRKNEPHYLDNYKKAQHLLYCQKAALLLDLRRAFPNDSRGPDWMNRRWVLLGWNQAPAKVADELLTDIEAVLLNETDKAVIAHAAYWRAFYLAHRSVGTATRMLEDIEPFLSSYPADERGAQLLALVANDVSADSAMRLACFRRLVSDYPATHAGKCAPGMIRRIEAIGKPFELSFRDATTQRDVSLAALRGKVVLIDFWATTCLPCVAEMPELKALYEKNRGRGLEIVGVSLDESSDQSGLTAFQEFIKKHEISWPQYYQGNGYDSEFSKSWGVGSAPTKFIVDRSGRLRSGGLGGDPEVDIERLLLE